MFEQQECLGGDDLRCVNSGHGYRIEPKYSPGQQYLSLPDLRLSDVQIIFH